MIGNVNRLHKNLGVEVLKHFQFIVPHQAGVNEVLQIKSEFRCLLLGGWKGNTWRSGNLFFTLKLTVLMHMQ